MPDSIYIDAQRRFGGLERLYGQGSLQRLGLGHVVVAGIGGVGSWCAEALARCGVGEITLIDLDHISESNINRQLHALTGTLGQSKVDAMAERLQGINPNCRVHRLDDFIGPVNVAEVFAAQPGVVIDCTDQAQAKIAMILEAGNRRLPLVVCGGAGGKTNPLSLRAGDLSQAVNDALLAKLRNTLRRLHGYPKAATQAGKARTRPPKMKVRVLWFDQPAILPAQWSQPDSNAPLQGLSCAGYGSVVSVTAAMGMAAANEAVQWLLNGRFPV
jgi:tRNA A37 threonylcarbamoyladenosine dehydratase